MGTNTPNYQLWKPDPDADNVNVVTDIGDNMDIIDTELKLVADSVIPILMVLKTADESVTSSVTLQTDDHLFLPIEANSTYLLDSYLPYSGAAAGSGGIKFDWTLPAGATLDWTSFGTNGQGTGTIVDYDVVVQTAAGVRNHATNAGASMSLAPRGTLVTIGTPGTLALRWAQAASNATATILKKNAWLRLMKL